MGPLILPTGGPIMDLIPATLETWEDADFGRV